MQHTCLSKSSSRGVYISQKLDFGWNTWAVPIVARHCSFADTTAGRAISAACFLPDMPKLLPHRIPSLRMAFVCPYPSMTFGGKGQVFWEEGRT